MVMTDATRLRQVLFNIVGNAVKFSAGRSDTPGRVTLHVMPDASLADGVRFEVRDNGIGISRAARAKLFQPFAQAEISISARFGGSGLGLSISQRLLALMGGRLDVDCLPRQGSCFAVTLPLPTATAPAPTLPVAPADSSHIGGTVLLVDDDEINRKVIHQQLSQLGYACETAEDGLQALAMWRGGNFALVLTDRLMPRMDGFELCQAIRAAEQPGARIPILILSADAQKEEVERSQSFGCDGYLTKPLLLADLGAALRRYINSSNA
jgi:CheY-like chemotaxis protein